MPNPFENPKPGESWTERGVKHFRYVFALLSVVLVLALISTNFVGRELAKVDGVVVDSPDLVALVAADMVLGMVEMIAGAFMTLFLLLGIMGFYNGRKEFGEMHEKCVKKAMIVIALTIGFVVVSVALQPPTTGGGYEFTDGQTIIIGPSDTNINDASVVNMILSGAMVVIGLICVCLILYFLLVELSDRRQKRTLVGAVGVIAVSALVLLILYSYAVTASNMETTADLSNTQYVAMFLLIPIAIGFCLMGGAFNGVHKRIKNKEIKPILPEIVTAPPITATSVPCGEMSPINVSSILASAHPLVEEIVRVEYKIRMPLTIIMAVIFSVPIFWLTDVWIGLAIIVSNVAIMAWFLWGYRAYASKYTRIEWGLVSMAATWRIIYWRTHLRNAQQKSYEVKDYYPYIVSDTLLMVKDIREYFKFKITMVLLNGLVLLMAAVSMASLNGEGGLLFALWIAAACLMTIVTIADLSIWVFLRIRFKDIRRKLDDFKSNIDAFWRTYG